MHPTVVEITERIRARSQTRRQDYLARVRAAGRQAPQRSALSCGNLAHAWAACPGQDKAVLRDTDKPNIAIVSSYNDVLSAHRVFEDYPRIIKATLGECGAVGQVAGCVPAMCDGVTQGQVGMELSLLSRDVIAMATAVALSHSVFDGVLCLGICDKIVPGLLVGALSFGHLPAIFVPGGPMPSGIPNAEKARVRQLYAQGRIGREALLDVENRSYHAPGTCTFYGTANTNQMLMEVMGLHVPGAAFVNPRTPLRAALTAAAARQVLELTALGGRYVPLAEIMEERALVNGIVGLLATGGSTNHALHLLVIARAAGVEVTWEDLDGLSRVTPLLARIYPNGAADVNQFHRAGGMAFLLRELLDAGLLHPEVKTVTGEGLAAYRKKPVLTETGDELHWVDGPSASADREILRPASDPFSPQGGLRVVRGNLGEAIIKISAVQPRHRLVEAPAVIFDSQAALQEAFDSGKLDRDCVAVVRFQGPKANGMPELHKLSPALGVLQDKGYRVALVTDGRMSGASGKVPAAIHLTPECLAGGGLAKLRDGDRVHLDPEAGTLEALVDERAWNDRAACAPPLDEGSFGCGRELFAPMRQAVGPASKGATVFDF